MKRAVLSALLVALGGSIAHAQNLRGNSLRFVPQPSVPSTCGLGRLCLWSPSVGINANKLLLRLVNGSDVDLTTGGGGGGGGGHTIVNSAGVSLTQRSKLKFSAYFALTDQSGSDTTLVDLDPTMVVAPSRQMTAGAGLTGGGDLTLDRSIGMPSVGPGAGTIGGGGSYINSITLDAQGRVTAAATGTPGGGGGGTVTSITAGSGLTATPSSPITSSGTLAVDTSVVTTLTGSQTLTNKTLTAPVLGGSITGTYTLSGTPTYSLSQALALGTTPTRYMLLENTTAAANNAQQVSVGFGLFGRGWQAGSTNASQTTGWDLYTLPVQGTTFPSYPRLMFRASRGGQSAVDAFSISYDENNAPILRSEQQVLSAINFGSSLTLTSGTGIQIFQEIRPASDFGSNVGEATVRRWNRVFARAYYSVSQAPTFSSTMNVDCSLGEVVLVTLTANLGSWTISNGVAPGQKCTIVWIQDATGSRTIGTPPAAIKWLPSTYLGTDHSQPTLTTAANKRDADTLMWDGTNWLEVSRNFNN